MRLSVPHTLGREAAVARIRAREHEIADILPSLDRTIFWLTAGYESGR